jgi:ABC-type branched-subunit amino acid transport system substrate-binding protein
VFLVAATGLLVALGACSSGSSSTSSTSPTTTSTISSTSQTTTSATGPTPGVTATSITVGQVDDLSAPLPGLFKGAEDGTQAYFDYVNSQGGVDGRKLVLDARDSAYQTGQVVVETTAQTKSDFALVGGFSLLDAAEQAPIDAAGMPDVAYPLSQALANDRNVYSPLPNSDNDYPVGIFQYLKKEYPTQSQHVGILWTNATSSTSAAESSFERAMKSQGMKIVYDDTYGALQTTFLPNVLAMKSAGVQLFFSLQLPDNNAAMLATEMQDQDFHPINVEGAAYSNQLVSLAGSAAEGMYIEQPYVLYLGEDAAVVPAVGVFDHWVKVANPNATFEIETVYGWASAELFVQALRDAGPTPTRAGLFAALDKITSFNANGLVAPGNPAQNIPSPCFLLAQVKNGKIVRVPPSPSNGDFYCGVDEYSPAAGFHPEVRPSPAP